jgi:hypothetical protein
MKEMMQSKIMAAVAGLCGSAAMAQPVVSDYDDLTESFLGSTFNYDGIAYSEVNGVGGIFPDQSTFTAEDVGHDFIIENAGVFYDDFPEWGSPVNVLTFGTAYVNGTNLSLGAFVRATMDLGRVCNAAGFDLAYYENGPWGGIVLHLDAMRNGAVVATDTITISDLGGRDNIKTGRLEVDGAEFDTLKIYATYQQSYSAPRMIMDDLTVTPAGASCYANCDGSTTQPILNVLDFVCFQGLYAQGSSSANCDGSTTAPILNVLDFICFQGKYAAGCP